MRYTCVFMKLNILIKGQEKNLNRKSQLLKTLLNCNNFLQEYVSQYYLYKIIMNPTLTNDITNVVFIKLE